MHTSTKISSRLVPFLWVLALLACVFAIVLAFMEFSHDLSVLIAPLLVLVFLTFIWLRVRTVWVQNNHLIVSNIFGRNRMTIPLDSLSSCKKFFKIDPYLHKVRYVENGTSYSFVFVLSFSVWTGDKSVQSMLGLER